MTFVSFYNPALNLPAFYPIIPSGLFLAQDEKRIECHLQNGAHRGLQS